MDQQHAILTITLNPAVDESTEVSRVVPDRKLRCGRPRFEPGGGGINVARAVHRLGGNATAYFLAGGYAGKLFEELLSAEGIANRGFPTAGTTRVNLLVVEKDTEQHFRFGMPGPEVKEKEWRSLLKALARHKPFPEFVVISGSLPPGVPAQFQDELAELAKRWKSRLLLDSSGEPLRHGVRGGVFLVKPNLRELRQVCGRELQGEEEIRQAALDLVRTGHSHIVVVSLGRAGAFLASKNDSRWIRTPSVSVQSKVGAGDSMMAGLALALSRGASELEAACYGVAAGASAVTTPGSELCRLADTEHLYKQVLDSLSISANTKKARI